MLDLIATPVGQVLNAIHAALSTIFISGSGPAWALSIVLLTIVVRILLFPLFVKQIKSQRRMQQIAPLVKELQKKHKGDRETLNTEMMKLYKEHGANPISGCLPLLLQLPVFFALFTVTKEFGEGKKPKFGLSAQDLAEGGRAQVFGAPISAAFNSSSQFVQSLGASLGTVRGVAIVMIVLMGASTFWTQRQMMARAGAVTDPQQVMVQKVLLYVLPLSFAISGQFFPIGVLLYWLTTNLWSMGQQAWVIKHMPPLGAEAAAAKLAERAAAKKAPAVDKKAVDAEAAGAKAVPAAETAVRTTSVPAAVGARTTGAGGTPARRPSGSKKRKNGRRGGRR